MKYEKNEYKMTDASSFPRAIELESGINLRGLSGYLNS